LAKTAPSMTHAVGNAMRSAQCAAAAAKPRPRPPSCALCQQVTDEGCFVPSTGALAVALRSAGQGRSSQLVKAKNVLANMPSGKKAALLDGLTGGRARLDCAGTAHVDWNTMIDNCFGLLCTSKEHVFLIKRDLLFDNTSTLPHAPRPHCRRRDQPVVVRQPRSPWHRRVPTR
jgi:hypothetical protein